MVYGLLSIAARDAATERMAAMRKVHKLTAPVAFAAMASVMLFEGSRPPRLPRPQVKPPLAAAQVRDAAGSGRPTGVHTEFRPILASAY